ncbi:MAG: hypothetical protein IPK82_32670 [Polyangiaceae bacterium]|nr:hypothetical protein [Polyangiaceae bacterium]
MRSICISVAAFSLLFAGSAWADVPPDSSTSPASPPPAAQPSTLPSASPPGTPPSAPTAATTVTPPPAAPAAPSPTGQTHPAPEPAASPAAHSGAGHSNKFDALVKFKPGTGAVISTADEKFSLAVRARIQLRYDLEVPHEPEAEPEHLFQVRRMRLQFQGNAFGKHNKFYVQLGLSPRDMTGGLIADVPQTRINPLRDARLEFDHLRDLTVWVGQMKIPFSRQRVVSSGNLEMVDRSIVNEEMQVDRDLGIQFLSKDLFGLNQLAYNIGVFMGEGRNAFEFTDFGLLWVARVEWLPFGKFDDYSEGDLARSTHPGLSIGVAYAFHDNAIGTRSVHGNIPKDGGTSDIHHFNADALFKYRGLSTHLSFHYRDGERNPGDAVDEDGNPIPVELPRNGVALLAQVGCMLPFGDLQAVGRYGTIANLDTTTSSMLSRSELAAGLSYYFGGHQYKIQVDYTRLWDDTLTNPDGGIQNGTDRLRAQVQLSL